MVIDQTAVHVGMELPVFARTPGFNQWNRFAAVNDEFVPWHMDDEAGREAGFPRAIGMGRLSWSYLHNVLRDWLGEDGRILVLDVEYRKPQLRDEPITVKAIVTAIREEPQQRVIDLDVRIEDSAGAVLIPGVATVALRT